MRPTPETIFRDCHRWSDYKTAIHLLSKKDKGNCFEALTKHYLELEPVHGTQLRHIWDLNRDDVPIRVRKHLNLPANDEGIDLIAETKEGHYWAIQCKYRTDESSSITRRELSTFTDLAFNVCRNIDFALVSTTAERHSHKFDLYEGKVGFCAGDIWRDLDEDFFRQVRARIKVNHQSQYRRNRAHTNDGQLKTHINTLSAIVSRAAK